MAIYFNQTGKVDWPPPDFEERAGQFVTTIRRDWLSAEVISGLDLNEQQQQAMTYLKVHGRITNKEYQELTGVTDRTVLREFNDLVAKGVLEKIGKTGRGTHYILKRKTRHKPDKRDMPCPTEKMRGRANFAYEDFKLKLSDRNHEIRNHEIRQN
jgi:predicted HTH transcriptional regulator